MMSAALLVLAAATAPADSFVSLRAIVAPTLACERTVDGERRQLEIARRKIDAMPAYSVTEQQQWQAAWDANIAKEQEFKVRRAAACKTDTAFEKMKAELARMRPDLGPYEVHQFAIGFFQDLRRTAEYAADFKAGHNARQYAPPSAPPPPAARLKAGT
ncbi:MAG: hypothetical protein ACKOPE_14300 [Novosphingobium sp.]